MLLILWAYLTYVLRAMRDSLRPACRQWAGRCPWAAPATGPPGRQHRTPHRSADRSRIRCASHSQHVE